MRTERDCIEHARQHLLALGAAEAELKAIEEAVKTQIQEAADFAQASPEPDPAELWTDVLASDVAASDVVAGA